MGKERIIPSDRELQKLVKAGNTHQQIANIVSNNTGVPIARSSISAALSRAGMTDRIRYDDVIPWTPIKIEHNMHYALTMLRLLARRKNGDGLDDEKNLRLDSWVDKMNDNRAVVVYVPESESGFHYVARDKSDERDSLVSMRTPEGPAKGGS